MSGFHITGASGAPICPEAEQRDAMSDSEFWEHALRATRLPTLDEDWPDEDPADWRSDPCTVCRSMGACGYDAEGRPLIHPEPDEDDE